MQTTVSSKYQIVIPRDIRRRLGIRPGQKVDITISHSGKVTLTPPLSAQDYIDKYAGTLRNTPWQKAGVDAAEWIRKQRDTEWD